MPPGADKPTLLWTEREKIVYREIISGHQDPKGSCWSLGQDLREQVKAEFNLADGFSSKPAGRLLMRLPRPILVEMFIQHRTNGSK